MHPYSEAGGTGGLCPKCNYRSFETPGEFATACCIRVVAAPRGSSDSPYVHPRQESGTAAGAQVQPDLRRGPWLALTGAAVPSGAVAGWLT